jgi:CopG antitoxin of type II toxin-antitoxin system
VTIFFKFLIATQRGWAARKKIPKFRSEDEERKFWPTYDSTAFIDWQAAERRGTL